MLGYAVYNYAFYLLGAALNVFFPLYVAAVVLAVIALILALSATALSRGGRSFAPTTPVRFIGGVSAVHRRAAWPRVARDVGGVRVRRASDAGRARGVPAGRGARPRRHGAGVESGGALLWQRRPLGLRPRRHCRHPGRALPARAVGQRRRPIRRGLEAPPGELPDLGHAARHHRDGHAPAAAGMRAVGDRAVERP